MEGLRRPFGIALRFRSWTLGSRPRLLDGPLLRSLDVSAAFRPLASLSMAADTSNNRCSEGSEGPWKRKAARSGLGELGGRPFPAVKRPGYAKPKAREQACLGDWPLGGRRRGQVCFRVGEEGFLAPLQAKAAGLKGETRVTSGGVGLGPLSGSQASAHLGLGSAARRPSRGSDQIRALWPRAAGRPGPGEEAVPARSRRLRRT